MNMHITLQQCMHSHVTCTHHMYTPCNLHNKHIHTRKQFPITSSHKWNSLWCGTWCQFDPLLFIKGGIPLWESPAYQLSLRSRHRTQHFTNVGQQNGNVLQVLQHYSNMMKNIHKVFVQLQQVHVNLWYKITHLLLVSSEAPLWSLLPPVFMYTHTRKRANGLLRSGGRWDSLRMFSSSSTEYTLWQTDSMKTFSPSQHVARRSVIASSSCRSGVSWSYKRRERVILLVIINFPHCHSYSHLIE